MKSFEVKVKIFPNGNRCGGCNWKDGETLCRLFRTRLSMGYEPTGAGGSYSFVNRCAECIEEENKKL